MCRIGRCDNSYNVRFYCNVEFLCSLRIQHRMLQHSLFCFYVGVFFSNRKRIQFHTQNSTYGQMGIPAEAVASINIVIIFIIGTRTIGCFFGFWISQKVKWFRAKMIAHQCYKTHTHTPTQVFHRWQRRCCCFSLFKFYALRLGPMCFFYIVGFLI